MLERLSSDQKVMISSVHVSALPSLPWELWVQNSFNAWCLKRRGQPIFVQIHLVMTSTRSGNPRKVLVKNPTKGTNITLHSFHISLLVTTILEKTVRWHMNLIWLENSKQKFIYLLHRGLGAGVGQRRRAVTRSGKDTCSFLTECHFIWCEEMISYDSVWKSI